MNPNESNSNAKTLSLVTAVGSGPIPTGHEPLVEERVAEFSDWLSHELEKLENHYRHNWTQQAIKGSIGR